MNLVSIKDWNYGRVAERHMAGILFARMVETIVGKTRRIELFHYNENFKCVAQRSVSSWDEGIAAL